MPQGRKTSRDDMILSTPAITESLGSTTSAGLTEGLTGDKPLFTHYNDTDYSKIEVKVKTKTKKI